VLHWARREERHSMLESVRYVLLALSVVESAIGAELQAQAAAGLIINEIMASNSSSVIDPQGQYDDWIELYNPGERAVDIAGMYLTDDRSTPTKWRIGSNDVAEATIAPGGYLLLWADGDIADPGLHTPFELSSDGEEIALFDRDGITPIDSMTFPEQVNNVSYGRLPDTGQWRFMRSPTPGRANTAGAYEGIVAQVEFSPTRGFYDAPFDVTLTCETPGAAVYCTLDGSEPYDVTRGTPTGTIYTGPIHIAKTACLRAIAVKPQWLPAKCVTHTYLFLSDILTQPARPAGFPAVWGSKTADYEMDPEIVNDPRYEPLIKEALLSIPSLSIVTSLTSLFDAQKGFYANPTNRGVEWERPCSVELIYPDGTAGFQVNCGIRVQGGAFRGWSYTPKKSLRLLFKSLYGPSELRYPLFGEDAVDHFNTITLRAGANDGYSWNAARYTEQYIRDEFGRSLQRATGNAGSHGMFVHLYVNGLYWGLYNPSERPDASFSASYYGGQSDTWDSIHDKAASSGNMTAWNQMVSLCASTATSNEAYLRLQGRNPDGTPNPSYPNLLDVTNYIDYLIVNLWAGNWDWPWKNWWAGRDRSANSTGFKFYCWDFENTMGNNRDRSPLDKNALLNDFSSAGEPHQYLKQNAEYRMLFADRVHRFMFDGAILTPESLIVRYRDLAAIVEKPIIAESARWGDQSFAQPLTQQDWLNERNWILGTYLPQRTAIVLQQFRSAGLYPNVDAPVFHVSSVYQHGGHVTSADGLTMLADGAVFYTLDGSDPRVPRQATEAGAETAETLVAENAPKRALVPTGPIDTAWRGGQSFDDSAWTLVSGGPGGVGYERNSGYEAFLSLDLGQQMYNRQTTCCVRISFTLGRGLAESETIHLLVRCDDGFVAYLNGGEIARSNFTGEPAWNAAANAAASDNAAVQLADFTLPGAKTLLRRGPNVLAVQAMNNSTTSSDLLISVILLAREGPAGPGGDISPTAMEYTGPITLSRSASVKARAWLNGVWSALNEAVYAVGPVAESLRISEIMYHPADPNAEYVELTNIGSESINLNLVELAAGVDFVFPSFGLAPGGYCLVVKDITAFEARYGGGLPVVGQYSGSLSNAGERIELRDAAGTVVHDFRYEDDWFDISDGMGYSLTVKDPRTADPNALRDKDLWRPSAYPGGSPGTDDEQQP
jgi:hypothetical protein